jgi:hypothetical protein
VVSCLSSMTYYSHHYSLYFVQLTNLNFSCIPFQTVTYGMVFALVYQLSRSYGVVEDNNTKRLFPRTVSYLVNFICCMTIIVSSHIS